MIQLGVLTAIEAGIEDYWNQTSFTMNENFVPEMMGFIRLRLEQREDSAVSNLASQIEALSAAATAGPWDLAGGRFRMNGGNWQNVHRYDAETKQDQHVACIGIDPRTLEGIADGKLIVALRNAVPQIIAALNAQAEVEALRAALAEIAALPNYRCVATDMRKIARKALGAKP